MPVIAAAAVAAAVTTAAAAWVALSAVAAMVAGWLPIAVLVSSAPLSAVAHGIRALLVSIAAAMTAACTAVWRRPRSPAPRTVF